MSLSEDVRRERARQRSLLTQPRLDEIERHYGDDPDVALLLRYAEMLTHRLTVGTAPNDFLIEITTRTQGRQ
jgi:hypothetical protein